VASQQRVPVGIRCCCAGRRRLRLPARGRSRWQTQTETRKASLQSLGGLRPLRTLPSHSRCWE